MNSSRRRALHATRAVTFGGFAIAAVACGTTPEPSPDAGNDTGTDTGADTALDTASDVEADAQVDIGLYPCSAESDGVCAEGCSRDDDADCCSESGGPDGWCEFSPEWGCSCAVEGPFAPPVFH